eukprot:205367_1
MAADPTETAKHAYIVYCTEKGSPPENATYLVNFSKFHQPTFNGVSFIVARKVLSNPPKIHIASNTTNNTLVENDIEEQKVTEPTETPIQTAYNLYKKQNDSGLEPSAIALMSFCEQNNIKVTYSECANYLQPLYIIPKKKYQNCLHCYEQPAISQSPYGYCCQCQKAHEEHMEEYNKYLDTTEICHSCCHRVPQNDGKWANVSFIDSDQIVDKRFYCSKCWIKWEQIIEKLNDPQQRKHIATCEQCGKYIGVDKREYNVQIVRCGKCHCMWNIGKKGQDIIVDGNTAKHNGYGFQNVYAKEICCSGKVYTYNIKIEELYAAMDIAIGVVEANTNYVTGPLGYMPVGLPQDCFALSYNKYTEFSGDCGRYFEDGQQPKTLKRCDKVQVILNLVNNTLVFKINGNDVGDEIKIPENTQYRLIVSLGDNGSAVTFSWS